MEYICVIIMKETRKREFDTREEALHQFMEEFGTEIHESRVKQVVATALDKWNDGIPPYYIEHDNLRFDIYDWEIKEASIGYIKDTDTLEYVFYGDKPPCYLSNSLTLSDEHHFLNNRIVDVSVRKGEEIEYLRKYHDRLFKDHLYIKMYKRYMPIQRPEGE